MLTNVQLFKFWINLDENFKFTNHYKELTTHRNLINEFVKTLVEKHEMEYQQKLPPKLQDSKGFLDHMYSIRHTLTFEETLDAIWMILGAGYDTTGKSIPSALLLLAMNDDEQEKVFQEISSVLSSDSDDVDAEKLNQMVYLDLVIKESLRLMPQTLLLAREVKNDVKLSKNVYNSK